NKLFDMLLIQVNRGRRLCLFGLFSNLKSKARSQAIVIHPALALVRRWYTSEQLECSLQITLIKGNLDQGGDMLGGLQEREHFLSLRLPGPKVGGQVAHLLIVLEPQLQTEDHLNGRQC